MMELSRSQDKTEDFGLIVSLLLYAIKSSQHISGFFLLSTAMSSGYVAPYASINKTKANINIKGKNKYICRICRNIFEHAK